MWVSFHLTNWQRLKKCFQTLLLEVETGTTFLEGNLAMWCKILAFSSASNPGISLLMIYIRETIKALPKKKKKLCSWMLIMALFVKKKNDKVEIVSAL